jgi:hypothetical protein
VIDERNVAKNESFVQMRKKKSVSCTMQEIEGAARKWGVQRGCDRLIMAGCSKVSGCLIGNKMFQTNQANQ